MKTKVRACDKLKRCISICEKLRKPQWMQNGIILLEKCNVLNMKDDLEWRKTGFRKMISDPK